MATIHISEAEAARDLPAWIDRVRDGAEVAIKRDDQVVAVLRDAAADFKTRTLGESLAITEAYVQELGYDLVMDGDFATDMEAILRERKPWIPSSWE